jgi:hypothetical protein
MSPFNALLLIICGQLPSEVNKNRMHYTINRQSEARTTSLNPLFADPVSVRRMCSVAASSAVERPSMPSATAKRKAPEASWITAPQPVRSSFGKRVASTLTQTLPAGGGFQR